MQARAREVDDVAITAAFALHFITMNAVEPRARNISTLRISICEWPTFALCIPFFARRGASLAAHTSVEVNHEAELFGG